MKKINDLRVILSYKFKIKIREMKSMIKNLFIGLMIMGIVFVFTVFQFGKMIILNSELINLYSNQIVLGISMVFILFTLIYKKTPLKWHPASMIYLSGSKFRKIFKLSLFKKIISYAVFSILIALILNNFKISFQTIQVFLSLWNLFIISIISRYFIYNKGFNIKIMGFVFIYTIVLNLQLYTNKYLSIVLILYLTYVSIYSIREALNTDFDFGKSFADMVFISRASYLARGNAIEDAQGFVRETSAGKNRKNFILKNMKLKNPLIQKNLITFSRINLTISVYIFVIFIAVIVLYKFELFEFVKTIKELGIGAPIVALHQALFINNIIDLMANQKNLLVEKSKEGLYLPYKKHEINKSFMVLGVPILLIATLMVGILFQKPIWIIGIGLLFYSIILLISLSFEKKKDSDFFRTIIYFAIFGVSYLLIK